MISDPFAASSVGVNEIYANNDIKIYPNPANDELHFVTTASEKLTAQLFDVSGKQVLENTSFTHSTTINISSLSEGMYFVMINNQAFKFIKADK